MAKQELPELRPCKRCGPQKKSVLQPRVEKMNVRIGWGYQIRYQVHCPRCLLRSKGKRTTAREAVKDWNKKCRDFKLTPSIIIRDMIKKERSITLSQGTGKDVTGTVRNIVQIITADNDFIELNISKTSIRKVHKWLGAWLEKLS